MELLRAEGDLQKEANALADEVFFVEQGIPKGLGTFTEENRVQWFCAVEDGRVVASLASWYSEGERKLGRYAVLPELRGKGIGRRIMEYGLEELFAESRETLHGEARDATVHILERYGAEITGEPFFFFTSNCTPLKITYDAYMKMKTE